MPLVSGPARPEYRGSSTGQKRGRLGKASEASPTNDLLGRVTAYSRSHPTRGHLSTRGARSDRRLGGGPTGVRAPGGQVTEPVTGECLVVVGHISSPPGLCASTTGH